MRADASGAVERLSASGWRVLLTESLGRGEYARRSRAAPMRAGRAQSLRPLVYCIRGPQVPLKPRLLLVLLAVAVLGYFVDLGGSSIWDANEAYYVETPREMIESGDYVNPSFNYEPRFNKPVLSYWIVAALYHVFGVSVAVERAAIAVARAHHDRRLRTSLARAASVHRAGAAAGGGWAWRPIRASSCSRGESSSTWRSPC